MKFSLSLLKKITPTLPNLAQLAELLNLHIFEVENVHDKSLEVSIPANRYSDAASHRGLARLISAVSGGKFIDLEYAKIKNKPASSQFGIQISVKKHCPRYSGLYVEISSPKPSPQWLQEVLSDCGLHTINNVVDVMNYVMLEIGQPLHAFDADLISGKINVRWARKDEKITVLDGKEYRLTNQDLVIADEKRPLAIAGIKGGKTAEVNPQSRRLIVESANFDSVSVYRTARRLNLFTDASLRFSHGLSPVLVEQGLRRAAYLLKEICGAKIGDWVDANYTKPSRKILSFDIRAFNQLTGLNLDEQLCLNYFEKLGFIVKGRTVEAPPERTDIEISEDLIEEIVNLYGYDKLQAAVPHIALKPSVEEDSITLQDNARTILINLGLDEVYNHSLIGGPGVVDTKKLAELENPISIDKQYLRPSLLPGLLRNVEDNRRFYDLVRIFEIGRVFQHSASRAKKMPEEKNALGIVLSEKKAQPFFELKGSLDSLLGGLGLTDYDFVPLGKDLRIESDHHILGYLRSGGVDIAMAEIDLEKLTALVEGEKEYRPLPKYPSVIRDLSFIVDAEARVGDIQNVLENVSQLVEDVDLIDWFQDEQKLGTDKKSLTFRLVFQSKDRTLTDAKVGKEMEKIISSLNRAFDVEIR